MTVTYPTTETVDACDFTDQAALENYFNTWLTGFTYGGGCDVQGSYGSPTVDLCVGGTTTVTFTVSDDICYTTTNVDVDFIVTPPAAVTVTYPTTETVDACDFTDQAALETYFNTWLTGFTYGGGCDVQGSYGSPTVDLCVGGTTTVTFTVSDDICYTTTNVDVDFIVTPPAAVTVTYPTTETVDACDFTDQAALETYFNTWLTGFTYGGGCDVQGSYGSPTVDLCVGGTTTVTFTVSDDICYTTTNVDVDFIVTPPAAVTVHVSDNRAVDACDFTDQAALETYFNTWLTGFTYGGGCDVQGSYGSPTVDLCVGGTTTVTFTVSDDICYTTTDVDVDFIVTPPAAVTVTYPTTETVDACDFTDQAALETYFNTWLTGFTYGGGCDVQGSYGSPTVDLCVGGTTTVTFTVSDDICYTTTDVDVDFIVTPPAAVTVTYPTTETVDACDFTDQAALETYFNTWLTGFTYGGGL